MIFTTIAFYVFASVAVASSLLVISARNPVHSVMFLILTFFSAAGLFVLLGAEFLAMLLLIVYVGAVAVLFLFVVMMLDIDFVELRQGMMQNIPAAATVGIILLIELIMVFVAKGAEKVMPTDIAHAAPDISKVPNTRALGEIIYTDYFFNFQMAGMVLLVAMIGAIVLTLHHRDYVKRQSIPDQLARHPEDAVELRDVKPGQGL
jgi:NADH-quinone oxidoreductase subunit J